MTNYTPKRRMGRATMREPVDHLPTQINYTNSMGEKLSQHYKVSLEDLSEHLNNHLLRLDISQPLTSSPDGKARFDWWGVGWSTETEGYWPAISPLADSKDLDSFPWPDPSTTYLLQDAERIIADDNGQHFIVPNLGFALYERAWALRGFEKFNMDLVLDPGFVTDLLDRITAIQETLAKRFLSLGVDGGYFGDDYGSQTGTLISPKTWRTLFKPRLARLFDVFRQAGLPVILHSDGDISAILPDLVEIGLTVFNPVQPEVIDLSWLYQSFSNRLAFYGGISTQTVLPFGSPAEVREAALRAMHVLAPDGTGLVLAPSHRLTADIPMQNVDALLDFFDELGSST